MVSKEYELIYLTTLYRPTKTDEERQCALVLLIFQVVPNQPNFTVYLPFSNQWQLQSNSNVLIQQFFPEISSRPFVAISCTTVGMVLEWTVYSTYIDVSLRFFDQIDPNYAFSYLTPTPKCIFVLIFRI